jgi:hypothetical protein
LIEAFVLFVSETLNDEHKFFTGCLAKVVLSMLHKQSVKPSLRVFWFELRAGPLELADLFDVKQMDCGKTSVLQ